MPCKIYQGIFEQLVFIFINSYKVTVGQSSGQAFNKNKIKYHGNGLTIFYVNFLAKSLFLFGSPLVRQESPMLLGEQHLLHECLEVLCVRLIFLWNERIEESAGMTPGPLSYGPGILRFSLPIALGFLQMVLEAMWWEYSNIARPKGSMMWNGETNGTHGNKCEKQSQQNASKCFKYC